MLHFPYHVPEGYRTWQLRAMEMPVASLSTACYGPKRHDKTKKSVLLIHGIGGDHHGMMPFGYELRHQYNVYIVELPGHGRTDIPLNKSYEFWKIWANDLLPSFVRKGIAIDEVVTHSFSCIIGAKMNLHDKRVTMLMPVARPTMAYVTYGRVMYHLRHIISPWYGWKQPAIWRGIILLHAKTRRTLEAVRWVSLKTYYSPKQFRYQTRIVCEMDGFYLFADMDDTAISKLRIIMSSHDTFSTEGYFKLRQDLPRADIKLVPGGHMLPIESPHVLAHELYGV